MVLSDNWVLVSSTGVLVQRHGSGAVSLAYATSIPTIEDTFSVIMGAAQLYPAVPGKNLYARGTVDTHITIEPI